MTRSFHHRSSGNPGDTEDPNKSASPSAVESAVDISDDDEFDVNNNIIITTNRHK
jgi:hypothetical protein